MSREFLGESLIFLISQPRAGSTLLQRILAGHPDIDSSAEPWLMLHPIYALRDTGIETEYNAKYAQKALADFLSNFTDGKTTYFEAIRAMAKVLYGRALHNSEKNFFLDKTPRYYHVIPELYELFPQAKFIILIRNALAVLHSIIATWINNDWLAIRKYRSDLLDAPRYIIQAFTTLDSKGIVIHYEELVRNPTTTIKHICNELNLSFCPSMLNYGNTVLKGQFGDCVGIRQDVAPNLASLNKWSQLANTPQTQHFALAYLEALGAQTVNQLGYCFDDIKQVITSEQIKHYSPVIPWDVAIRPYSDFKIKDKLLVRKTLAIQSEGTWQGSLKFTKELFLSLINLARS